MSKFCPIMQRRVVYLDCLECEEKKECKTEENLEKKKEEKEKERA